MKIKILIRTITAVLLSLILFSSCSNVIYKVPVETHDKAVESKIEENESATDTVSEGGTAKRDRISFLAVGDNMNHMSVFKEAAALAASVDSSINYYYGTMYENVAADIAAVDIAFVNQESPIAGDGLPVSGYPAFNAPEEAGKALVGLGFDVINIANNHMLDMDNSNRSGYLNSIKFWKTQNVTLIGGYEDLADYDKIRITEKDGFRIAWLSYTYGTNGKSVAPSFSCVVPYIDRDVIKRQIALAKESAELVFVSVHWGEEGSFVPNSEQTNLAQYIADLGADAVIGHHSHTMQPVKWITGSGGNKTLCVYSLGNFICTMLYPYYLVGGMLKFDIARNSEGKAFIDSPVYEPIMIHYKADQSRPDSDGLPTRSGIKIYYLKDYTNELCAENGSQLYQKFTLDTLRSYVMQCIDKEFQPDWMKK